MGVALKGKEALISGFILSRCFSAENDIALNVGRCKTMEKECIECLYYLILQKNLNKVPPFGISLPNEPMGMFPICGFTVW